MKKKNKYCRTCCSRQNGNTYMIFLRLFKLGRSSSSGAKSLSFLFRQLTEDFKEENTEKESVKYRIPISYSPEGRGGFVSQKKSNESL